MSDIESLKRKAREQERAGNVTAAIELYARAVNAAEADESAVFELDLYARIGDLYLKLDDSSMGAYYYLQAVDRHLEEQLHTKAAAYCEKAQRVAPEELEVQRKLAAVQNAQGLHADAVSALEQYLEGMAESHQSPDGLPDLADLALKITDGEIAVDEVLRLEEEGEHEAAGEALVDAWRAWRTGEAGVAAEEEVEEAEEPEPVAAEEAAAEEEPVEEEAPAAERRSVTEIDEEEFLAMMEEEPEPEPAASEEPVAPDVDRSLEPPAAPMPAAAALATTPAAAPALAVERVEPGDGLVPAGIATVDPAEPAGAGAVPRLELQASAGEMPTRFAPPVDAARRPSRSLVPPAADALEPRLPAAPAYDVVPEPVRPSSRQMDAGMPAAARAEVRLAPEAPAGERRVPLQAPAEPPRVDVAALARAVTALAPNPDRLASRPGGVLRKPGSEVLTPDLARVVPTPAPPSNGWRRMAEVVVRPGPSPSLEPPQPRWRPELDEEEKRAIEREVASALESGGGDLSDALRKIGWLSEGEDAADGSAGRGGTASRPAGAEAEEGEAKEPQPSPSAFWEEGPDDGAEGSGDEADAEEGSSGLPDFTKKLRNLGWIGGKGDDGEEEDA